MAFAVIAARYDKRVVRGNTYASLVQPQPDMAEAGTLCQPTVSLGNCARLSKGRFAKMHVPRELINDYSTIARATTQVDLEGASKSCDADSVTIPRTHERPL